MWGGVDHLAEQELVHQVLFGAFARGEQPLAGMGLAFELGQRLRDLGVGHALEACLVELSGDGLLERVGLFARLVFGLPLVGLTSSLLARLGEGSAVGAAIARFARTGARLGGFRHELGLAIARPVSRTGPLARILSGIALAAACAGALSAYFSLLAACLSLLAALLSACLSLLAARFSLLSARRAPLAASISLPAASISLPAASISPLAAGCSLLAASRSPLAASISLPAASRSPLAAGCSLLAACRWPYAAGCSLLAAGRTPLAACCSLLAAGRWPLAAGRSLLFPALRFAAFLAWPLGLHRWLLMREDKVAIRIPAATDTLRDSTPWAP
ncbi:MAG: hypothetical protein QM778_26170 [Myxococcales bacterium]